MRRAAARTCQVLGQNGREGGRHVLRDQHREAVDHRTDLGNQRHQRLWTARRRTDQQDAWRMRAERAARQRGLCGWLRRKRRRRRME